MFLEPTHIILEKSTFLKLHLRYSLDHTCPLHYWVWEKKGAQKLAHGDDLRRWDCRTRLARPNSRGANADREILFFPVQLTMSRIGNLTRLILTLAICVTKTTPITGTALKTTWSCAGGLLAVNAIGTQLRKPINAGVTRWPTYGGWINNGRRRGNREESRE